MVSASPSVAAQPETQQTPRPTHCRLFPETYLMYRARSVAKIACLIIFSVVLYSSMDRPLRIWLPFGKKENQR